jgi:hypothetical protein
MLQNGGPVLWGWALLKLLILAALLLALAAFLFRRRFRAGVPT